MGKSQPWELETAVPSHPRARTERNEGIPGSLRLAQVLWSYTVKIPLCRACCCPQWAGSSHINELKTVLHRHAHRPVQCRRSHQCRQALPSADGPTSTDGPYPVQTVLNGRHISQMTLGCVKVTDKAKHHALVSVLALPLTRCLPSLSFLSSTFFTYKMGI